MTKIPHDSKKCPYCAEIIKKEAAICRFCNRELKTKEICPKCGKVNPPGSYRCRNKDCLEVLPPLDSSGDTRQAVPVEPQEEGFWQKYSRWWAFWDYVVWNKKPEKWTWFTRWYVWKKTRKDDNK